MRALALIPILALAACASGPAGPAPASPMAGNSNDCAVIAAVARDHYRFGPDNAPPPLWLDGGEGDWSPRCDWARYGVAFPRTYDPDAPRAPGERIQWVAFKQPRYQDNGRLAVIEAGIMHGPLAGMGVECRARSGVAGWSLEGQCRNTWIS
ncbi:MAG: hypothetical protein KF910_07565 [Brevundimonas sp.]|uniref:hypothetical protein n=1 Tax=Brevundimonas sp. TaxID=1871086 RepID=UPI0025C2EB6F|nr:hypothetical protein [Brevundimonas sp.]MBX3477449.1 hypothetical protein [Brevundimonas sp.]